MSGARARWGRGGALLWMLICGGARAATIDGELFERGTRTPIAGAPVLLRAAHGETEPREVLTDGEGRFVFDEVSAGAWLIDVFVAGYEPMSRAVRAPAHVVLRLAPSDTHRTVVGARSPKGAPVIGVAGDEAARVPGTSGDPAKVVGALPGVARPMFGLGDFAVRGAGPEHTGTFIDGHPTRYLYHLLGGPGVVDPALVGGLVFYPGGAPAWFGRAASATVAIELEDPPRERWHLDAQLDPWKAGVLASVPVGDGVVTLSFRRSWLDALLPLFTEGLALGYTDYQLRWSHALGERVGVTVAILGAEDRLHVVEGKGSRRERIDVALGFHRVTAAFAIDLSPCLRWVTRAMLGVERSEQRVTEPASPDIALGEDAIASHLLTTLAWRPARGTLLTTGVDVLWRSTTLDSRVPAGAPLGEPTPAETDWLVVDEDARDVQLGVAPFVHAELDLGAGVVLTPGVRADVDIAPVDSLRAPTIDPRLALRWTFAAPWTLTAMAAIAHQPPPPALTAMVPGLGSTEALQASLGLEWARDGWLVALTGWGQSLDALPRSLDDAWVLDRNGERVRAAADGEGRALGAELFVRKRVGDGVHGWLAYTLSRAERRTPSERWRLYERDQTHVLHAAAAIELGREWTLGLRFELASGAPTRPVIDATYDADGDVFAPRWGPVDRRLPLHHRLDLRLDKTWRFDTWQLQAYLEVQNVYAADNPETLVYDYDYGRARGGPGLPILPTLGARVVY